MTKEELDFIGSMNMCDEISNEAYKKIVNHIEETEISDDCVSRSDVIKVLNNHWLSGSCSRRIINEQIDKVKDLPPVTHTFPKGATNGDMIIAMFPAVEVREKNNGYEVYFGVGTSFQFFNHQWWNAPYKRGGEE